MSDRINLKEFFKTGEKPSEDEYADLIDSTVHKSEDKANTSQAINDTIDDKYITPKTAKLAVEAHLPSATINNAGIVRRSSVDEVANGTDVNAYMTPSNTVIAIEARSPELAPVQSVNDMTGDVVIPVPEEVFAIINSNGSIKAQSGSIQISSQRNSAGNYSISFNSPLANNNYFIAVNNKEDITNRDDIIAKYDNNSNTGFDVWIGEQDNGTTAGVFTDREFMIHIRVL